MSNHRLTLMRDHKEFVLQPVLNIEQTDKFIARKGYFFTFHSFFYISSSLTSNVIFCFCLIPFCYFFLPPSHNPSPIFSVIRSHMCQLLLFLSTNCHFFKFFISNHLPCSTVLFLHLILPLTSSYYKPD